MNEFDRQQASLIRVAQPTRADSRPARMNPPLVAEQNTLGNQGVMRFIQSCPLSLPGASICPYGGVCHACPARIQTKLRMGRPDDEYEREADRVAEAMMEIREPSVSAGESIPLRRVSARFPGTGSVVETEVESQVESMKGCGKPLSQPLRSFFEGQLGCDLAGVRVHTDGKAAESAKSLNALAYAAGEDIVFGAGEYEPGTASGKRLLAHELVHTMQQENSSKSTAIQRRVDPARITDTHCRTCVIRRPDGSCDFWLTYSMPLMLENADSGAIAFALRASNMLFFQRTTFGTRAYNPADAYNIAFRDALLNNFNLDVENPADHARIRRVENRYQGVANLLQSGRVRYRCRCGHETNWAESYNNSSANPRMWICRRYLEDVNATERALTLLHEPFHILYGLGHTGTINNIFRYESFATDLANIPITLPAIPVAIGGGGPTAQAPAPGEEEAGLAARGDDDIHSGPEEEPEEEEKGARV